MGRAQQRRHSQHAARHGDRRPGLLLLPASHCAHVRVRAPCPTSDASPRAAAGPSIVCVLPLPLSPYARIVELKPARSDSTMGSPTPVGSGPTASMCVFGRGWRPHNVVRVRCGTTAACHLRCARWRAAQCERAAARAPGPPPATPAPRTRHDVGLAAVGASHPVEAVKVRRPRARQHAQPVAAHVQRSCRFGLGRGRWRRGQRQRWWRACVPLLRSSVACLHRRAPCPARQPPRARGGHPVPLESHPASHAPRPEGGSGARAGSRRLLVCARPVGATPCRSVGAACLAGSACLAGAHRQHIATARRGSARRGSAGRWRAP